ncbi:glycosyltransferase family 4 protein [Candidatus Micrarchaeota archaeon]|nr:glycosyltransferase family 4 protein [Candidatus Micrarchaeota archaeon]
MVKEGYCVDVQWNNVDIKKKLESRFGIKLKGINFVKNIKRGDGCEVCFWVSDGSVPLLRARNNILHFQFPFTNVDGKSLLNRMKFFRINHVVCNSTFTKNIIDQEYGVNSRVVYPPVDVVNIKPKRKENIILSVGRFSQLTQAKRQDVLIRAFIKLLGSKSDTFKGLPFKGGRWKLILAGGSEVGAEEYVAELKEMTKGFPIEIIESPDFKTIKDLFGRAKIFWSASGYGIDEKKEPKKVEHFGIAVVEAMTAGVAPLVYNAGGHKEIITDGSNGFLWNSSTQLFKKTKELISDKSLLTKISRFAKQESKKYSYEKFEKEVAELV